MQCCASALRLPQHVLVGSWTTLISETAPHVTAAAAILKSFNSTWSNVEIRDRLQKTAVDLGPAGRDNTYGFGLINIRGALDHQPPPPPPPPPFSVTIVGNTEIEAFNACQWYASTSGGTAPFTYSWTVNGQAVGDNSDALWFENDGNPFTIAVTVTDQNGQTRSDDHSVAIVAGMFCT